MAKLIDPAGGTYDVPDGDPQIAHALADGWRLHAPQPIGATPSFSAGTGAPIPSDAQRKAAYRASHPAALPRMVKNPWTGAEEEAPAPGILESMGINLEPTGLLGKAAASARAGVQTLAGGGSTKDYLRRFDDNTEALGNAQEDARFHHPVASFVASAPLMAAGAEAAPAIFAPFQAGKGAGLGAKVVAGFGNGGALGAASGLGHSSRTGDLAGTIADMFNGASSGALGGAGGEALGAGLGAAGRGSENFGYRRAVASFNPTKRQLDVLRENGGMEPLGRFAIDKGIVGWLPSGAKTLESRAEAVRRGAGSSVGGTLDAYDAAAGGSGGFPMGEIAARVRQQHVAPLRSISTGKPAADRLEGVAGEMDRLYGTKPGMLPATRSVGGVDRAYDPIHDGPLPTAPGFDSAHGVTVAPETIRSPGSAGGPARAPDPVHDAAPPERAPWSIRQAQKEKQNLYDLAFGPDVVTLPSRSPVKANLAGVGSTVKRAMEEEVGTKLGPEALAKYLAAKDDYARSKILSALAGKRGNQELANRFLKPSDYGIGATTALSSIVSHPEQDVAAGGIKGVVAAIGHGIARKTLGPPMAKASVAIGKGAQFAAPAAALGGRVAASRTLPPAADADTVANWLKSIGR